MILGGFLCICSRNDVVPVILGLLSVIGTLFFYAASAWWRAHRLWYAEDTEGCEKAVKPESCTDRDSEAMAALRLHEDQSPTDADLESTLTKASASSPCRGEEVMVVLCCFRETREELEHAISTVKMPTEDDSKDSDDPRVRLMVFVDGLQNFTCEELDQAARTESSGCDKTDEVLSTLRSLASVLPLGQAEQCYSHNGTEQTFFYTRFTGMTQDAAPFEIYVKGKGCAASKRESHRLCLSVIDAEPQPPKALLLLDGDCRVEPNSVKLMYKYMCKEQVGGVGPRLAPEEVTGSCHVLQCWIFLVQQYLVWLGQSCLGMRFPLNGSCAMFSLNAIQATQEEYLRPIRIESIMDSMMIESGEDSFLTNLVLAAGFKIVVLPSARATSFMPDTWLEYLAQQVRWKQSWLGARTNLLFQRPSVWAGHKHFLQMLYFMAFLWTPHAGAAFATTLAAVLLGKSLGEFLVPQACRLGACCMSLELLIYLGIWGPIAIYTILASGVPVKSRPILHRGYTALVMSLGLVVASSLIFVAKVHTSMWFWTFNGAVLGFLALEHFWYGSRRLWVFVLFALSPVVLMLECVQQTAVAVANADNSSGWGTRLGTNAQASVVKNRGVLVRQLKRQALMCLWICINFSIGAVLLALDNADLLFKLVAVCGCTFAMFNLLMGMRFSIKVFCRSGQCAESSSAKGSGYEQIVEA